MLKIRYFLVVLFLFLFFIAAESIGQSRLKGNPSFLYDLMAKDVFFKPYLDNPEKYEIQIIYTQIDRNSQNNPNFTQYDYRLNNRQFFNPASLVKWPLILLGMEKVNNLNEKFGVSIYNKIGFSSASRKRHSGSVDRLAPDKKSRLVNYIKEMILVSDNNAYNRMYDFLGQGYINNRLTEMGYDSLRILHRFDDCTVEQNRTTPSVSFYNKKGVLIYKQPSTTNPIQLSNPLGEIVKGGKDYSYFNNAPLQNINDMMLYVFFKESVPQQKRFNLTESDYRLLYKYTAMHPAESEFYVFKKKKKRYPVHLKKYLYYGKDSSKPNIPGLRIHNMVGESHGTLSDVAYFVNPSTGVEFMLSAVINTCDGDITPANYHYKDVGFPFLERLGEMIYQYELHRK